MRRRDVLRTGQRWSSGDEAVLLWVVDTLQFANVGAIELTPSQTGLQEIAVIAETQTCEESPPSTVEVLDNPAVSLLDINQVDVDCFGASTGVIEVLMDASAPLDYVWSGDVSTRTWRLIWPQGSTRWLSETRRLCGHVAVHD